MIYKINNIGLPFGLPLCQTSRGTHVFYSRSVHQMECLQQIFKNVHYDYYHPSISRPQEKENNRMRDKFKYFRDMIKTRDIDSERFKKLMKNSLHDEYMYTRENAPV